jgi:hypothetical protein
MSTDYHMVCFDCKEEGPTFASASIAYGFKVWVENPELLKWIGHREAVGHHEGHDLRIVPEGRDLPWVKDD